ncbi:MAG TPA: aminoglycoside 6-adenylyltransferase [candidate division Zixibacteria bacterium]|nr:aminoglycoside 6-adenylyltransferase [candidate division Zixibacteria bacterium]
MVASVLDSQALRRLRALSVGDSYEQLIRRFCEWAKDRADIRAVFVIGSRARANHPADEWADLDLVIVTTNPEYYLSTTDWINSLGKPLLTFIEPTPTADEKERRVLFEGMLDVDFAILPQDKAIGFLQASENQEGMTQLSNALGRGMRILLDKDQALTTLQVLVRLAERPAPKKPTEQEFQDVVSDFLYHAVFTAKHLRRGELWWTLMCLDCRLQDLMKTMIEWHTLATHEWKQDVWFRGRFLEEWAEPKVTNELRKAFAHYDKEDIKQALRASTALFSRIANETAHRLSYRYPTEEDRKITEWVEKCLAEEDKPNR